MMKFNLSHNSKISTTPKIIQRYQQHPHYFWTLQELATFTHSCKKCLAVIEKNHQTIQKIVHSNKTLQHMDMKFLQKRVADLQVSSQVV